MNIKVSHKNYVPIDWKKLYTGLPTKFQDAITLMPITLCCYIKQQFCWNKIDTPSVYKIWKDMPNLIQVAKLAQNSLQEISSFPPKILAKITRNNPFQLLLISYK